MNLLVIARRPLARVCLVLTALALAGCATAPSHPTLQAAQADASLAPLVPMRRFVANVDAHGGFALSPDGQRLLWFRVVGTDAGLAAREVDQPESSARRFATGHLARRDLEGGTYGWLPDSRHAYYVRDPRGDEATQIHVVDTRTPGATPWPVTPWPGARSTVVARGEPGSARFFFASNRRDKATFDLYEADAATRTVREVARSDGRVTGWLIGTDRQLAGRWRKLGADDGSDGMFELATPGGGWRVLKTVAPFEWYSVQRLDPRAGKAWVVHRLGRDKAALFELDLANGQEKLLAEDAAVDLQTGVFLQGNGGPVAALSEPGLPRVQWLDAALGAEVEAAARQALNAGLIAHPPRVVQLQSSPDDHRRLIVRTTDDFDAAELLLDRATGQVTRLDRADPEAAQLLVRDEPFSFTTSDGRTVHGYLMRPRGVAGRVPLVVNIHGGPWTRDQWSRASFGMGQMLANRGYAVLRVNYRSSAGYGRDHMMAGALQTHDRVQRDIAEAAQWAVDQGIADPARMAVLGASFGGFSVLQQLILKHHDWRCGVDLVGVADWARLMQHWPPFWRNRHWFTHFYGDPATPEGRAALRAASPRFHLDRITSPLLVIHGANDIRVLKQDSDDVVAALRARGQPVAYLVFPGEGHSTGQWRNRLAQARRIEDFLAGCLGGRSAGWDWYELMPVSTRAE